ncbi:hypothetical protein N7462_004221 [Penicillium macrosclerotiorum]|uniref:uncharacterized protein n=1 Tax=Penicillium macrosclerotiorum TaxID=303699 RepID=UPI0025482816|nr:uncharacterized protein N7462_004221 [Penicillium macrosclerotiorum]KAJ5689829.1 hypothetical protein N7462_004221 [Penicillium macrosclerotiorum]
MSLSKVSLSLTERLDFIPALATIVVAGFYALLTGVWRSERQAKSLLLHFGYAIFRQATARLSPTQMQAILPRTNKVYDRYAKQTGLSAQTVDLGDGALGHWVGDRDATNVLIWFHGGGFALPASIAHFKFFSQLIQHCNRGGKRLAIFSLTYSLAPQHAYPTQLRQAVAATRYILSQSDRDPATVFLGGDSAGGNLVGGVLSHLAHPHPQIEPIAHLTGANAQLGGAVMIAPWTLLDTEFPGQEIYHGGDIITTAVAGPWSSAYLGPQPARDFYTDLSNAPTDWFARFPVQAILVTCGGNEIMMPIIQDFAQKLQAGFPTAELFVGLRECHVAPVYNLELGDKTETEQGKKVKTWLVEHAR